MQSLNFQTVIGPFFSFLLASWTFDEKDGMQKLWIFMAGLIYICVIMVYLKVHASKKKVDAPMSGILRGITIKILFNY